ncbi:MAG: hypothetical protein FJX54_03000 [Alphaproteobacteria bacterium]|nr:hypothetical protein [Alphaproteobacteria bacterium]
MRCSTCKRLAAACLACWAFFGPITDTGTEVLKKIESSRTIQALFTVGSGTMSSTTATMSGTAGSGTAAGGSINMARLNGMVTLQGDAVAGSQAQRVRAADWRIGYDLVAGPTGSGNPSPMVVGTSTDWKGPATS